METIHRFSTNFLTLKVLFQIYYTLPLLVKPYCWGQADDDFHHQLALRQFKKKKWLEVHWQFPASEMYNTTYLGLSHCLLYPFLDLTRSQLPLRRIPKSLYNIFPMWNDFNYFHRFPSPQMLYSISLSYITVAFCWAWPNVWLPSSITTLRVEAIQGREMVRIFTYDS